MMKILYTLLILVFYCNSSFAALKTDFASGLMECSVYAEASKQNNFIEQLSCYRKNDKAIGCTVYVDKNPTKKQKVSHASFCFNAIELSLL